MTELIREDDTLNQGRKKLNNAIKAFNETVVEGDSSVEAAQARVDEKGEVHPTLKARIDNGFTEVSSQLAQIETEKADRESLEDISTGVSENSMQISGINKQIEDLFEQGYNAVSKTQVVFEGSGNMTKSFSQYMDGFSISNIGTSPLFFTINSMTIRVPAGMGYDGFFEEFTEVYIESTGKYYAIVRGKGDYAPIIDTFSRGEFGVTDTGETYSYGGRVSDPIWMVEDGKAYLSNPTGSSESYAVIDYALDNVSIKSDVTMVGGGTNYGGLALKHLDDRNWIFVRGDSAGIVVLLKSNGSWNNLTTLPFQINDGDTYELKVTFSNKVITVFINNSKLGSYTMSALEYYPIQAGRGYGIVVKNVDTKHDNLVISTM